MSRYLDRALMEGERPLYVTTLHWIVYARGAFVLALAATFGHFGPLASVHFLGDDIHRFTRIPIMVVSLAGIAWGAIGLLIGLVRQMATELIITNHRVIAKHGLVATTTYELLIQKVEGANIDQTVLGRILGFGTILVKGTGGGISPIDHVSAPYKFQTHLLNALERSQKRDKSNGKND